MSVFSLKSDNEFITPYSRDGESVYVRLYKGDTNDFNTIGKSYYWISNNGPWGTDGVRVGPTEEKYKALELFGTIIEGDGFQKLVNHLKAIEGEGFCLYVNRLGLCIITNMLGLGVRAQAMRINDYFGWSEHGVTVPQDMIMTSAAVWNRFEMSSGATVIDVQGLVRAAEEGGRELLEEKNVELSAMKKELEEKSMELAACKQELEWSKKMESALSKLVEEKEKVDGLTNQLLALKADDHSNTRNE